MNPLSKLFTPGEQRILLFLMGFALLGLSARFFARESASDVDSLRVTLEQSDLRIDLRNPVLEDLMALPGIGEKKARAIMAYAESPGFARRSDLMKVHGIGEKLYDGMLPYLIPLDNETAFQDSLLGFSSQTGQVNINRAGVQQLMEIEGIGEVLATRIVRYRNKHGRFKRIDDLLKVNGIGEKTLQKMKPEITLGE